MSQNFDNNQIWGKCIEEESEKGEENIGKRKLSGGSEYNCGIHNEYCGTNPMNLIPNLYQNSIFPYYYNTTNNNFVPPLPNQILPIPSPISALPPSPPNDTSSLPTKKPKKYATGLPENEKKKRRLERNRQSAKDSRKKKKKYIESLESEKKSLLIQLENLKKELSDILN